MINKNRTRQLLAFSINWRSFALTLSSLALGTGAAASAADSGSPQAAAGGALEEIVVTAQRRSQSIQDVSISMVALTGAELKALGANNAQELAQTTPNVSFESFYPAGKPIISIRGLSMGTLFTNFEQSPVGIYNDDVYMGSRSGQLAQMFDLDRVEILRGPQGTLFGRNTTAGAISFISQKPTNQFEVDGELTYGRWNEVAFEGGMTLPVSDTLSIRVAGIKRQRDGWQYNVNPNVPPGDQRLDNIDNWGARALVQWKPTSDMAWLLNLHGNGNNTHTPVIHGDLGQTGVLAPNIYTGYQVPGAWNQVSSDGPAFERLNSQGASLTGTIQFGDITLTSISAYERVAYDEAEDDDGSPYSIATFAISDVVKQYSQELRLAAKHGPFDWVAGVYYYTDDLSQNLRETSFTDPFFNNPYYAAYAEIVQNAPTQASHNEAIFGDIRYALANQWTLDVGARYTYETKHLNGVAYRYFPYFPGATPEQTVGGPGNPDPNVSNKWSAPTGRAAIEWRPAQGIMTYASWSRGFKSGGYNGLAVNDIAEFGPYKPETDSTTELGVKTTWLDGRVTANAAIFYNKIKDLQALYVPVIDNIVYYFVRNAADGTTKGAEFEVKAQPGGGWLFSIGIGLLNSRYDNYVIPNGGPNYSGEEFISAPKQTGNATVQYTLPLFGGTLAPFANYSYQAFRWTDNPHRPGIDAIPGYGLLNMTIPWTTKDERLTVALWAENLTDKHYFLNTIGNYSTVAGAADSYHGVPRTYGIRVGYRYH